MLLQLGCTPQALFWDVTTPLRTSLANGALLFLVSLPFVSDHSSLENHPLVSKAGIIWPQQRTCLVLWLSRRCLLTLMSTPGGVSWGPQPDHRETPVSLWTSSQDSQACLAAP